MISLAIFMMLASGVAANLPDLVFKLTLDVDTPTTFSSSIPLVHCNVTNFDTAHLPKALVRGVNVYGAAVKGKVKTIGTHNIAVYDYSAACTYGDGSDVFSMSFSGVCVADPNSMSSLDCLQANCGAGGPAYWNGYYWTTSSKKCNGMSGTIEIDSN
jgi:hypothetical protein